MTANVLQAKVVNFTPGLIVAIGCLLVLFAVVDGHTATTYFSDNFESGNLNAWDNYSPAQDCETAVATQAQAHGGNWAMNISTTPNVASPNNYCTVSPNPGIWDTSCKMWRQNFDPGPGRGPKDGMLEGYYSSWHYFGSGFTNHQHWHNVFQHFTKDAGPDFQLGAYISHLGVQDFNGVFQANWQQSNCYFKRHPVLQDGCPTWPSETYTVAGGLIIFRANPIAVPLNQWVHFEVYSKHARTGGVTKVWQDGQLIFDLSDATKSGGPAYNNFDSSGLDNNTTFDPSCQTNPTLENCYSDTLFSVNTYHDCDTSYVLHEHYVDDVLVSDTLQSGVAPAAPTNLRVVSP